jgi:hypothetical protein
MQRPEPSPALAEMLAKDGELDAILEGRGITLTLVPQPTGTGITWGPPLNIPAPNWEEERRERLQREREAQAREDAARLEAAEPPTRPTRPAGRHRWNRGAA